MYVTDFQNEIYLIRKFSWSHKLSIKVYHFAHCFQISHYAHYHILTTFMIILVTNICHYSSVKFTKWNDTMKISKGQTDRLTSYCVTQHWILVNLWLPVSLPKVLHPKVISALQYSGTPAKFAKILSDFTTKFYPAFGKQFQ